jgi:hypothetical protein
MHQSRTLDIGMDGHPDTMAVAYVANAHDAEVVFLGTLGTRHGDRDPLSRKRPSKATPLLFVDDAGPCGSWLSRDLTPQGDDGWGVAPSWRPHKTRRSGHHRPPRRRAIGPPGPLGCSHRGRWPSGGR